MAEASQTVHAERHRATVESLVTALRPVRPLWPEAFRFGAWLLLEIIVALWVATHTGNDFASKLTQFAYALEVLLFAAAAMLAGYLALRAAVPGLVVTPGAIAIAIGLIIAGTTLIVMGDPIHIGRPIGEFTRVGLRCAMETCLLAAIPWLALWWAVKRAAPTSGALNGALIGAGAALYSFALMRINCPIGEPAHLIVWHLLPALFLVALSGLAGLYWLRFRTSARDM